MDASEAESSTVPDGACVSTLRTLDVIDTDIGQVLTEYKMNHKKRGLGLIFSHEHFNDEKLTPLPHTKVDSAKLERALKKLDFRVTIYKDLTHLQIKAKINDAAAQNHANRDCILVAFLTNGDDNDKIHAKDESYQLESIWQAFAADKCKSLAGKPKIFIVQACRGKRRETGYLISNAGSQTETDGHAKIRSNYRIPCYSDFLIAFCTIPKHCSWGNTVEGSWFIHHLCAELEANGRKLNMLHLLTFVAQRVSNCESYDEHQKQITCTMSTLTRDLHLAEGTHKMNFDAGASA
ncbi:caspase [Drosophila grimshawi]|uniref:GH13138 n=1 Tax=Drosophila grimshawi TaxID=7222 RepID=B4JQQ6_DROGR|nr:caspase [Drosophila grimshawi]EDV99236.1 GH13138 [Drosophila grimshawi]